MTQIDLNKYKEFVNVVTSDESKNNNAFTDRWVNLVNQRDADMPRLVTAAFGLGAFSTLSELSTFKVGGNATWLDCNLRNRRVTSCSVLLLSGNLKLASNLQL